MERELFGRRLREAATVARDFARKFIEEPLPDPILFRLRLNSSYDGNARVGDETVFPEDGSFNQAERVRLCNEQEVVDALWREGRVPEWIDVAVIGETGDATLLQLMCCGRFTADEGLLYHAREGCPPFHVTGPVLPVGYEDGQKFSVYDRSECWTLDDVDHLRNHAHKVWSLDLVGHAFDDESLENLPSLSRMELLELKASSIRGHGLAALLRFSKLRVLRIGLDSNASFCIPKLSANLSALEMFGIDEPPRRPWGFKDLVDSAPALKSLTFNSQGELFVDGECPQATETIHIRATRIVGGLELPETIDAIYAHLTEMNDRDIDAWLGSVKQISGLDLGGSRITDALAEELPARFGLSYLNVADTNVSEAAMKRISSAHPKLKLLPNLKGQL